MDIKMNQIKGEVLKEVYEKEDCIIDVEEAINLTIKKQKAETKKVIDDFIRLLKEVVKAGEYTQSEFLEEIDKLVEELKNKLRLEDGN